MLERKPLIAAAAAACAAVVVARGTASAQTIIRSPGNHINKLEIEVHGVLGFDWRGGYGGAIGPGFRVGIPVWPNGPIQTINNSWAINFGADVFWWPNGQGAVGILAPVTLQWNFFLTERWSVFGEAGFAPLLFVSHSRSCGIGCDAFFALPGAAVGARLHFPGGGGYPTLTMRLGFPSGFNIGVSF